MIKVILTVIVVLLLGALGAALFVESGIYNIGADDHHMNATLALIVQLRDRSIEMRLGSRVINWVTFCFLDRFLRGIPRRLYWVSSAPAMTATVCIGSRATKCRTYHFFCLSSHSGSHRMGISSRPQCPF